MTERILFVDDEPKILEAYRRTLRKNFTVLPAEGGKQALEILQAETDIPVVVSDMQMPEMNGVEFLTRVKEQYPDIIRVMLTGNADQQTAIDAINTSDVHHFLNKPCPPDKMINVLEKSVRSYYSQHAEKELLDKTLRGSISSLSEVLSLARPNVFGRISQIKSYVQACAVQLGIEYDWSLESVAILSQIGLVSLPESIVERVLKGNPLPEEEQKMFDAHPSTAADIICKIPRMEEVANSIRQQNRDFDASVKPGDKNEIPFAARVIRPVIDLVNAQSIGLSGSEAMSRIESSDKSYDPEILSALLHIITENEKGTVIDMNITALAPGAIIAQDIHTFSGALLIEKGQEIGPSMLARLLNFWHNDEIPEKLCVLILPNQGNANSPPRAANA
ncbi:MAG: response regulator [Gammaproteobacteria bacterium]|nr:response regulator [Gammaproteobacteria bacterium]MBT8152266.1 response regulator [Gammaproteobacteria bacterium]NNM11249.1 response regulator [Pseudomonadales bacterium]